MTVEFTGWVNSTAGQVQFAWVRWNEMSGNLTISKHLILLRYECAEAADEIPLVDARKASGRFLVVQAALSVGHHFGDCGRFRDCISAAIIQALDEHYVGDD